MALNRSCRRIKGEYLKFRGQILKKNNNKEKVGAPFPSDFPVGPANAHTAATLLAQTQNIAD